MKTISTLTVTLLMALSLNAFAGNASSEKPDDRLKKLIPTSPFVWENPDEASPEGIRFIKAKYALVPLAPFVWGNADDQVPELLKCVIAVNADVPVAPFVWGNANDQVPEIL